MSNRNVLQPLRKRHTHTAVGEAGAEDFLWTSQSTYCHLNSPTTLLPLLPNLHPLIGKEVIIMPVEPHSGLESRGFWVIKLL